MQLVASVFLWISPALALIFIINQEWFWLYAPESLRQYASGVSWGSFIVGLLALFAAWYGGEHFILRQVRALTKTAQQLIQGNLEARTGLKNTEGELGQLASTFDGLADSLQKRQKERDRAEQRLLDQAHQQTIVAALGQCALTNDDLNALFTQGALLTSQMLLVEYAAVFQRLPDGRLLMLAGSGWKTDRVGSAIPFDEVTSQAGFSASTGEVAVVADYPAQSQFQPHPLLVEHGVVSGVTAAIPTRNRPFGVLAIFSASRRAYSPEEIQFLLAAANTIGMAAERKRAELAMQQLAAFVKENPNPALELDAGGEVNYFNGAAQQLVLAVGKSHPREILPENYGKLAAECLKTGRSCSGLETHIDKRTLAWSLHPVPASQVVHCYGEEITSRLNLEEQLRQSQKMDSIGQLAAGVAHDFNNMLTIIQGQSSKLLTKTTLAPDDLDAILAVYGAAERAAGLTRQLLMFTRKNVMQPRPIDLRQLVDNLNKMLCRMLGETIALHFKPPAKIANIYGDHGMIEQVLMNLVVNAHDAMPQGGTLTIALDDFRVSEEYASHHPDARAGQFVRLQVTDTGCGMNAAVRARIFEPFFTTKEVGKGTGLGLATVFGIVKQHSGWVEVASETGQGSTFTIYFPASEEVLPDEAKSDLPAQPVSGGSETVLVVEDEMILREMARDFLTDCGYRILEAGSGREAQRVWQQHRHEIQLLLTDMKMPEGVSGLALAEQMLEEKPGLRVIFTSGYSDDVVSTEFLTRTNSRFLAKPYSYSDLTQMVRDCLDSKNSASAS